MTLNKYFNGSHQKKNQEGDLVQNWITESIQITGVDCWYLKREIIDLDPVFGEDKLSEFKEATQIEMKILDIEKWDGMNDIIADWGSYVKDQVNLQVSSVRFKEETGMKQPREGDLIYFDFFNKGLWEIKFVEDEEQFYPLGILPSFTLKCHLFDLSGESFDTDLEELDARLQEIDGRFGTLDSMDELNDRIVSDNEEIEEEANEIIDRSEDTGSDIWGDF